MIAGNTNKFGESIYERTMEKVALYAQKETLSAQEMQALERNDKMLIKNKIKQIAGYYNKKNIGLVEIFRDSRFQPVSKNDEVQVTVLHTKNGPLVKEEFDRIDFERCKVGEQEIVYSGFMRLRKNGKICFISVKENRFYKEGETKPVIIRELFLKEGNKSTHLYSNRANPNDYVEELYSTMAYEFSCEQREIANGAREFE